MVESMKMTPQSKVKTYDVFYEGGFGILGTNRLSFQE